MFFLLFVYPSCTWCAIYYHIRWFFFADVSRIRNKIWQMMAGKWHFKCQLEPLKNIFYHEIIELRCCREWSGYARGNTVIFLVRPVFVQPPWFGFLQTKHLYLLLPTFLFLSVCLGRHFSPRASDLQDISLSAHRLTQPLLNSVLKTQRWKLFKQYQNH